MIEYYIKIKAGYEYCKKNLESELNYDQFLVCKKLVDNYVRLCEFYLRKVKNKHNYKYTKEVCQECIDILVQIINKWQGEYDDQKELEEKENSKSRDIMLQMMVANDFRRKEHEHRKIIAGFKVGD